MHLDPLLLPAVEIFFIVALVGMIFTAMRQPSVIGYLAAGVIIGPSVLALVDDPDLLDRLGAIGVVMLLFFVGMEIHPRQLASQWRVAFVGTTLQIVVTTSIALTLAWWLDWPLQRGLLLGFMMSLSSTAVVLKYLESSGQMKTQLGKDALAVLLAQDVLVVPMMIIIGIVSAGELKPAELGLQLTGTILVVCVVVWLFKAGAIRLPLGKQIRKNHELQLFVALIFCLGCAYITGVFGLSTALGAFIGGMIVGVARETNWIHHQLDSLRTLFVALFFVSVGMLTNIKFVAEQWAVILGLLALILVVNTLVNALVFRTLGEPWRYGLRAGAMLAQIGEFSFLLAALGYSSGVISQFGYQLLIAVTVLSLAASPIWLKFIEWLTAEKGGNPNTGMPVQPGSAD